MPKGKQDLSKLKVNLKLAVHRLKLLQSKKASINQAQRREIALLLEGGKDTSARIRVENIIREDFNAEAMEILELYCELLLARIGLLEHNEECEPSLIESVKTIIYAAPRSEVQEMSVVRDILVKKYGPAFAQDAMDNKNGQVNSRIVHKLKIQTPDPLLVNQYLIEIAKAYNVVWDPETSISIEGGKIASTEPSILDVSVSALPSMQAFPVNYQNFPKIEPLQPSVVPTAPSTGTEKVSPTSKEDAPDFDELTKRFEALKNKK